MTVISSEEGFGLDECQKLKEMELGVLFLRSPLKQGQIQSLPGLCL